MWTPLPRLFTMDVADGGWVHQRPWKRLMLQPSAEHSTAKPCLFLPSPWPEGLGDSLGVLRTLGHEHWLKVGSQGWNKHNQLIVSGDRSGGQ